MKRFLLFFILTIVMVAESNITKKEDTNLTQKNLQEQLKREQKYAKEKTFYYGKDYNLSEKKVDEKTLSIIPVIEPEDDFDMDDVYSDIQ